VSFYINKEYKLESADAAEVTEVDLDQGDVILWTNLNDKVVTVKFDEPAPGEGGWMLPTELTIQPHDNAVSTIRTGVDTGEYSWRIICEGTETTGKIHLPPPKPGSGTGEGGG
jgi:hypothetical protein